MLTSDDDGGTDAAMPSGGATRRSILMLAAAAAAVTAATALRPAPASAAGALFTGPAEPESVSPTQRRLAATQAWGGYSNGQIPTSELGYVGNSSLDDLGPQYLRSDAAVAWDALNQQFVSAFGVGLVVNEGYRNYERQVYLKEHEGEPGFNQAAEPGTSIHGWALAADFGSNVNVAGSAQKVWMNANAPTYGWQPTGDGFAQSEPWHFEYDGSYVPAESPEQTATPEQIGPDMKLITRNDTYWLVGEFTAQLIDNAFVAELKDRFGVSVTKSALIAALKAQYGEPIAITSASNVEGLLRVANYNRLELIASIKGS